MEKFDYSKMYNGPYFGTVALLLARDLNVVGCGDNSCRFVKPNGMATNGGCRCHRKIESALQVAYTKGVDSVKDSK